MHPINLQTQAISEKRNSGFLPPPARARLILGLLAVVCTNHGSAQEGERGLSGPRFSADVGMGVEYDGNIAVEEIDRSSNQSDYAMTLNAGLEVEQDLSQSADIRLTYDYNQRKYSEFSRIDRQTHILGTNIDLHLAQTDAGVSLYYINSRRDGDPFLELYRLSPSLSGFLSKKWFARAAYVYSDRSIENKPLRDAIGNNAELDAYYFRRGLRSYFNIGYRFKDHDAKANQYDFSSHSLKLRYIQRVEVFSKLAKIELAWRYEDRDYSSVTPNIGEKRDDQRHRWRLDFELPLLSGNSALQVYYGYGNYDSNQPSADYRQTLTGMRFVHRW